MTQCEKLRYILTHNKYVFIKDIRGWCKWTNRISDCREKYSMDIRSVKVNGMWAYEYVGQLKPPTVKQTELFNTTSHDGVVRLSLTKFE